MIEFVVTLSDPVRFGIYVAGVLAVFCWRVSSSPDYHEDALVAGLMWPALIFWLAALGIYILWSHAAAGCRRLLDELAAWRQR